MNKLKKYGIAAVAIVIFGLGCFFVGSNIKDSEPTLDAVVLENQLSEINELASVTYSYTNMGQFENKKDFYGMTLPFTTKKFILSFDGEIKAGVNLGEAKVDLKGTKVKITIPDAKILSHTIDESSIEVFDEKTSIFNSFSVKDYTKFTKDQKVEMEKKALEKGLLEEANVNTKKSVEDLIQAAVPNDYVVTVE